jgi:hypothetical protein
LSKIVKHKEPWSDLAVNGGPKLDEFKNTLPEEEDETGLVSEEGGDEE